MLKLRGIYRKLDALVMSSCNYRLKMNDYCCTVNSGYSLDALLICGFLCWNYCDPDFGICISNVFPLVLAILMAISRF